MKTLVIQLLISLISSIFQSSAIGQIDPEANQKEPCGVSSGKEKRITEVLCISIG